MTPYERFKSLPNPEQYLKPGVTIEALDAAAMELTDLESAKRMKMHVRNYSEKFLANKKKFLVFNNTCGYVDNFFPNFPWLKFKFINEKVTNIPTGSTTINLK